MRPTTDRVREAWFSALGDRVVDATVLDLFAGSGALGLEALSRGARHVIFVDNQRAAVRAVRQNLEALGVGADRATVLAQDVFKALSRLDTPREVALADPPYGTGQAGRLVELFLERPFAKELWVEHRSGDLPAELPASRVRRYGDTILTTLATCQEASE